MIRGTRRVLWVALGAVVATSGAAQAQELGISGTLEGGYSNYDTPGSSLSEYHGSGAADFTIDNPGLNIQANFSNSGLKVASQSADIWRYDGDLFWRDRAGAFGINAGADSASSAASAVSPTAKGKGLDIIHYGIFGEFYAVPQLTLRAKGGRIQSDATGYYTDVGMVLYPLSSIALSLDGDYIKLDKPEPTVRDIDFKAEYMPVRDVPFTVSIGYTYAVPSQLHGHIDVLSVGIKWYFGGDGRGGTLMDYQRNGPTTWDGPPPSLVGIGF